MGEGRGPFPLEPINTIFSEFLPLNYVICIFKFCFFKFFFLCGRAEEACCMVKSLRIYVRLFFRTPLATIYQKNIAPPPEKIGIYQAEVRHLPHT